MTIESLWSNFTNGSLGPLTNNVNISGTTPTSGTDATSAVSLMAEKHAEGELTKLQKMVKQWKEQSVQPNLRVEFAKDTPMNQIWMNLVDNTTGQVIFKFPPEAMRMLAQHNQVNGLITDVRT